MSKRKSLRASLHPVQWFHDWEDRILLEHWIPIRFQPILFVVLFIGILFVVIRRPTLPSMTASLGNSTGAYIWLVLALACPPILFGAWWLIRFGTGRKTYFGYWMRFAADIGQTWSFTAWLLVLISDPSPEVEDAYAWIVLSAILLFLIVLVVRDVLKLVLLERTSSAVQGVKDEDAAEIRSILDARDAADVHDALHHVPPIRDRIEQLQHDAHESAHRADKSEDRETEWSKHLDHARGHNHGEQD